MNKRTALLFVYFPEGHFFFFLRWAHHGAEIWRVDGPLPRRITFKLPTHTRRVIRRTGHGDALPGISIQTGRCAEPFRDYLLSSSFARLIPQRLPDALTSAATRLRRSSAISHRAN